jgi:hypothetical protein
VRKRKRERLGANSNTGIEMMEWNRMKSTESKDFD